MPKERDRPVAKLLTVGTTEADNLLHVGGRRQSGGGEKNQTASVVSIRCCFRLGILVCRVALSVNELVDRHAPFLRQPRGFLDDAGGHDDVELGFAVKGGMNRKNLRDRGMIRHLWNKSFHFLHLFIFNSTSS